MTEFQRSHLPDLPATLGRLRALLHRPGGRHRILFRAQQEETLLRRRTPHAVIAPVLPAPAVGSAVLLIIDYLFSRTAWGAAGLVMALLFWLWWHSQPWSSRSGRPED